RSAQRFVRSGGHDPSEIVERQNRVRIPLKRFFVMIGGVTQQTLLDKRVPETGVRAGVVRMDGQRGLVFGDRAVEIAFLKKRGAKIVMRVRKIRPEIDRLPQMNDRFVQPTFAREHIADAVVNDGEAEIVMALFTARTDVEGFLKIGKRVVE